MKKLFIKQTLTIFSTTLVVFLILFGSCSTNDTNSDVIFDEASNYQELVYLLNGYTDDYNQSHNNTKTRGGWRRFWKSVKADYCGYTDVQNVRHEAVSISASRKYWKDSKAKEIQNTMESYSLTQEEQLLIESQIEIYVKQYKTDRSNFGALHNAAILSSLLNSEMDYKDTKELAESTLKSLERVGYNINNILVNEVINDINVFFDEIYSEDTQIMFDRLIKKYPNRSEELQVLCCYLTNVEDLTSVEDIEQFTAGYLSIVNNSSIDEKEKEKLTKNISIAPSSFILWREIDGLVE